MASPNSSRRTPDIALGKRAPRIAIVGGGITGLAVAHALERLLPEANIVLFEASQALGGNLRTEEIDGFLVDHGPDSWVAQKPEASALARAVGLGNDFQGTRAGDRRVFVVKDGVLSPIPEGFILGVPTKFRALLTSNLLSPKAKLRLLAEPLVPRRRDTSDESVGSFVERRLGKDLKDVVAAPLLGGIFAGDVDELSMQASFPQLIEAERRYGSLIVAMRAREKMRKPGESAFVGLKKGAQSLPLAVAKSLRNTTIHLGTSITQVAKLDASDERGRYILTSRGEAVFADGVFFTGPAVAIRPLVTQASARAGDALASFEYASAATVFFAFSRDKIRHPLSGLGFIIPSSERQGVLASTWVSSKWEGRAPAGHVLLRVFVGGAGDEELVEREDAELVQIASTELARLMGIHAEPLWTRVFRYRKASPQPRLEHLARVRSAREVLALELPGVYALGSGYDGTGIPDCVRQATTAAESFADLLKSG